MLIHKINQLPIIVEHLLLLSSVRYCAEHLTTSYAAH